MPHSETSGAKRAAFLALVAPGFLLLAIFFLLPILRMVEISFFHYSPEQIWTPAFTFNNYLRVAGSSYFLAVRNSLVIAFSVTIICAFLAYPYAYFLARTPAERSAPYLLIVISPLLMSSVVLALGWVIALGPTGPIQGISKILQLQPFDVLYTTAAVILGLTHLLLPFMILPLLSSIENIHPSLEEAAQNLGASRAQVFIKILVPLSRPGLVSGALLVFPMALGSLVIPALLGGPRNSMLGNVIYEQVMTSLNWPFASAIGILLLLITCPMMLVQLRFRRSAGRRTNTKRAGV